MAKKRTVFTASLLFISVLSCDSGGPKAPVEPPFEGTVEGLVSTEEGVLAGVAVELTGARFLTAQTSTNGSFSFPGLPEGSYQVAIDGFPQDVEFTTTSKGATVYQGKGQVKVDFKGAKKRDASLTGSVTMEGVGMVGMSISISGPESRSTATDAQGAYSFDELKRGSYSVVLQGFDPVIHAFPNTEQSVNLNGGKAGKADFPGTLVPQPPDAPTALEAQATSSSTVVLDWTDNSNDETRFDVERRVGSGGAWSQVGASDSDATSFEDLGLSPNTAYGYRVRACNDAGCSLFSNEAEATTHEVPPDAPANLEAVATGPFTVELNWTDESDNETRFEVERKEGAGGTWGQIGVPESGATAFGDTGLSSNTAFVYRVRACNAVGCSDYSGEANATTDEVPPEAPSGLVASATGSTTVFLTWTDASDNEDQFEVERKTGPGNSWTSLGSAIAEATAMGDEGLVPNTSYTYRVRACNVAGCSGYSNESTAVTNEVVPHAPQGLVATATGATTVDLTWTDASSNEARFRMERREGSSGLWVEIAVLGTNVTSHPDGGLASNTGYTYRVRACNDIGCSSFSNEAGATTHEAPPVAPTGLGATATGASTIDLSWVDQSGNETGFLIERKDGTGGSFVQITTVGANVTTLSDSGLSPSTAYVYRIRACNGSGCSPFSGEAGATTHQPPPQAPTGLTATGIPLNTVDLSWTDMSGDETLFRVERKEGATGTYAEIATPPANTTTYSDPGLGFATTYYYRVKACNAGGCSTPSNEADATTWDDIPNAPTGLALTVTGSTTVDLAWTDASDNETGFKVERDEAGAGTFSFSTILPINSTSFGDTGLTPNTLYTYRVTAFNGSGQGVSGTESVTTWAGGGPNLNIANLYLTQSTQTLGGDVPLVANRDGFLRVFAVASEANSFQPSVRVEFYHGGGLVHTETLLAPGASVPTGVDESTLPASWNVPVAGSLIQPGLTILAEVDPTNVVAEGDEGDNFFPVSGSPLAMDVRTASDFEVTFVPVRQSVNNLVGNVTAGNAAQFMDVTMRMLPIAQADVIVHAEYVTNAPVLESNNGNGAWGTILSEINSLRVSEGFGRYYYGVVKTSYGSGVAGMGYLGWPAAIGWDHLPSGSGVAAHEWGHNWDLRHSPGCGAGNPDPLYPYADGKIGVWGLDVTTESLKSPDTRYDFMTYCNPDWISDYTYEKILDYRQAHGAMGSSGAPEPSLLVWGRVEDGRIILEPSFEITTTPVLPMGGGDLVLEGTDGRGGSLFSLNFVPTPVPDAGEGNGHFAFAIPLRSFDRSALAELMVSGAGLEPAAMERRVAPQMVGTPEPEFVSRGGSVVEMTWDDAQFPMALVRDPITGEVLSFARNGRISLPLSSNEVEVLFSDGLNTPERIRRTVR